MLEELLYAWLVVRFLVSIALGLRAANRLRHDETSRWALGLLMGLHAAGSVVTWLLEAAIRMNNAPPGPAVQVLVFPMMLLYTVWVPIVDLVVFLAVTALVAHVLVRRRLSRYRDELLLGEPEQRVRAARACAFLGWWARSAVPELVEVMGDPDPEVRFRAGRALGRVQSTESIDPLRRALADRDPRVRVAAACALGQLGETDEAVVAGVVDALGTDDDDARIEAVRAAKAMGPAAAAAIDRLVPLADHWKLRWLIPVTLQAIGEPAVPALAALLGHEDAWVRSTCATTLGQLGAVARPAVPELMKLKADPRKNVRDAARVALRNIGN